MRKYFFRTHHRSTRSRAQAMVEFALVLPLLLVVVIGIFEFSRLLFAWIILENSTRFGIRYATTGTYDPAYCPGGVCDTDAEVDAARVPSIWFETQRMVIGFFKIDDRLETISNSEDTYFNVTVCTDAPYVFDPPVQGESDADDYASCTLSGSPSEHPGAPGNRVYVAADYNFKFMVMPLFGVGPERIHLASYRMGYVEQFRSARAINTPLPMSIPTSTPSITNTPLPPTLTFTSTVTNTPVPSATASLTPTRTLSPTPAPSNTPAPSRTPTITRTPSRTPTRTLSPTITLTPSITPTRPTSTRTLTPSRTPTRPTSTRTLSPTATLSRTPTRTRTQTSTPLPSTPTFTPGPPTNTRTRTPVPTNTTIPPTTAPTNTRTPTRPPPTPTICLDC